MSTTKITRLTLLLLFALSVAAQESSGIIQGINCFGKEYVCVGPLNYKHCEWDAQGNNYAAGNVIQCPSNHRCVNDGVEICIPLKLSTTAPLAESLITSEHIPVNSISTEDPIKIIPLKWEFTSTMPDTTTDMVVNKELSSISVDTTTAAEGSIWTTFLTDNSNTDYKSESADVNIHFTTSPALETTTDTIIITTELQYGSSKTSDLYTTLIPIISDDSSLSVKSSNLLENGTLLDVPETSTVQNIPSDPNFTETYYSTVSPSESLESITHIYPETTITVNEGQTRAAIDVNATIYIEGSTDTSPLNEPLETTTLIDHSISVDSNASVNPSKSDLQNKISVNSNNPIYQNASSSSSLPVEHNPQVDPNIPIELISTTDSNTATIRVDQTNSNIPGTSSVSRTPAITISPVEHVSSGVLSDPSKLANFNAPFEHNLPMGPYIPIELSSLTGPMDQSNTVVPNPSPVPSPPASQSLPNEYNIPVDHNIPNDLNSSTNSNAINIPVEQTNAIIPNVSSDPSIQANSSMLVEHNSLVNHKIPIDLNSSISSTVTNIPLDQINSVVSRPSSDPSSPASPSLPVGHNSLSDPNIPIELNLSTPTNTARIRVDQANSNIPSTLSDLSKPTSVSLPFKHKSGLDTNNPMKLSSSIDPNATTTTMDHNNSIIPASLSPSLSVEHNSLVNPNNLIELSSSTNNNTTDFPQSVSSKIPVDQNSTENLKIEIDLYSSTDPNPVKQTNTIIAAASYENKLPGEIPLESKASTDSYPEVSPSVPYSSSVHANNPNDLRTLSDHSAPAIPRLPVAPNSLVDHNMDVALSASTNPNTANILVDKTNIIIPSSSLNFNSPASSSLLDSLDPIELSASIDPNTATISNVDSDASSTVSKLPVKSNPSPASSPSFSPLDYSNQIGLHYSVNKNVKLRPETSVNIESPVTLNNPMDSSAIADFSSSANAIKNIDSRSSALPSEPLEKFSPPRNQLGKPKAPVTSTSSLRQSGRINTLIDSSASGDPNKLVDHTSPIYLSNTNKKANNSLVLSPKHPLGPRWPTSPKKPIHQETIEVESFEANSSKSALNDDDSIERKSLSNSKKTKKQRNFRNNKRKEETVERESSEISLPEKRQSKDTSVENKSGANSKESKESKDVKVEHKPDDEDDESASSEQKELIKKILKKIKDSKCDEDDVYPDPKDCKKYYRCLEKNHKKKITHLRCESGDRFDSDKLKCVDKRKVKCFSKKDFIEEFA